MCGVGVGEGGIQKDKVRLPTRINYIRIRFETALG